MNKKTIYIIVAVLVVVIVVGVAGVLLLNNGTTPEATPTPEPSTAPSIEGASSLIFSVDDTTTATGDVVGYTFTCDGYGTAEEKIRVDMCIGDETYSYILDAGQEKSWVSMDNGATWMESDFTADWTAYGTLFSTFTDKLLEQGNSNDLTYTTDTSSISIYCVAVDQTIPESTFAVS